MLTNLPIASPLWLLSLQPNFTSTYSGVNASASRRFQPGEGPSRVLLRDSENRLWNWWIDLLQYYPDVWPGLDWCQSWIWWWCVLLCSYLCPLNPELSTACTVFISDIIGSTLHSSMYFLHLLFTLTILWMSIMVVQYYTLGGLHFTLANLFYSLDLQMHLSYLNKSTSSESGLIQFI